MIDMDKILKEALTPTECPSDKLNKEVFDQIKNRYMEVEQMGKKKMRFAVAAIAVLVLLILPASAYAAYKYLLPKEAAKIMEDEKLGQAFEEKGKELMQSVTDGIYKVTYLGHVTGESISDRTGSAWELHPERLYVAVAVERTDQTAMDYKDEIFVSPLIQGLAPWKYNIVTMNGSYMGKIIDGVLYRIIECDNIEIFADRKMYLAVSSTAFFSEDAFHYNETTGEIKVNDDFNGANVLFDLKLDPSKADPVKAQEYLEQFEKEWNADDRSSDIENDSSENENEVAIQPTYSKYQQEFFEDEENGINIRIKDNNSRRWSAGLEYAQTILQYYLEVSGDNIDTLTFSLNKGEFCDFPEHSIGKAQLYGNECSLSYDEQKNREYLYSVYFRGNLKDYGYDPEEVEALGQTDIDARDRIKYDVLSMTIADTKMQLKIKMNDGKEIIKNLTFKNVMDDGHRFWISINVDDYKN